MINEIQTTVNFQMYPANLASRKPEIIRKKSQKFPVSPAIDQTLSIRIIKAFLFGV